MSNLKIDSYISLFSYYSGTEPADMFRMITGVWVHRTLEADQICALALNHSALH